MAGFLEAPSDFQQTSQKGQKSAQNQLFQSIVRVAIDIMPWFPIPVTKTSDVRGHGRVAGNVSTFFNSKSGNCNARRLSAISVAKNHPKVFSYADSN